MLKHSSKIFVAIVSALIGYADIVYAGNPNKCEAVPSISPLTGISGAHLSDADLKGKVVVMQFFASWCVGCEKTMSDVSMLLQGRKDLVFVPVSVDEDVKSARSFFAGKSATLKSLEAKAFVDMSTKFASQMDINAIPSIVVSDKNGKIIERSSGHPDAAQLDAFKRAVDKAGAVAEKTH